jgi:hypothetical protein
MRLVVALLITAFGLVGCTGGGDREESPPPSRGDPAPVVDDAPYLCDFVPERTFRNITGLSIPLRPKWDGAQTGNGLCLASTSGREAPLGVAWSYSRGNEILKLQRDKYRDDRPIRLPKSLGDGFAVAMRTDVGITRPNYVIALFRCDKRQPWLRIDFDPVVKGRNVVRDMIDLMRIAQKRFGEIHQCTPQP